jgi:hypothetical protein
LKKKKMWQQNFRLLFLFFAAFVAASAAQCDFNATAVDLRAKVPSLDTIVVAENVSASSIFKVLAVERTAFVVFYTPVLVSDNYVIDVHVDFDGDDVFEVFSNITITKEHNTSLLLDVVAVSFRTDFSGDRTTSFALFFLEEESVSFLVFNEGAIVESSVVTFTLGIPLDVNATFDFGFDVQCGYSLGGNVTRCIVFVATGRTLEVHKFGISQWLGRLCKVLTFSNATSYNVLSLQAAVHVLPLSEVISNEYTTATVALAFFNELTGVPEWQFYDYSCADVFLPDASFTRIRSVDRSGVASVKSAALVQLKELQAPEPLGVTRLKFIYPSPFVINEFLVIVPSDAGVPANTFVFGTSSDYARFTRYDFPLHGLLSVGVTRTAAGVYAISVPYLSGTLRDPDTGSAMQAFYAMGNAPFEVQLSERAVECPQREPDVLVGIVTENLTSARIFTFTAATLAPTPAPVSNFLVPYRSTIGEPMPNSVNGGRLLGVTCVSSRYELSGVDLHSDQCSPYANVPGNNHSSVVWFSLHTPAEPAAHFFYTTVSSQCDESAALAPTMQSSVISTWDNCLRGMPDEENGEVCSNTNAENVSGGHSFLGVLCFDASSLERIRVRNQLPGDDGSFDFRVEEWTLRRGGDTCKTARTFDVTVQGQNEQLKCNSAVYTNLCAPRAGRDLSISCSEIGSHETPTTWFAYETRSMDEGPVSLSIRVVFNDTLSLATSNVPPFYGLAPNGINVTLAISVWSSCDTLTSTPLICRSISAQLGAQSTYVFDNFDYADAANSSIISRRLRAHTLYYVAVSTDYVGDFGICAIEVQPGSDEAFVNKCDAPARPGNCSDVCSVTGCNPSSSLDYETLVQSFSELSFAKGNAGELLNVKMPGVVVTARAAGTLSCLTPMLMNTSAPAPGDCTLGTPNARFGGPGCGAGGAEGGGVNFLPQGLCLIVSEDNNEFEPKAMRQAGATLTFYFCVPVQILFVTLINARHETAFTFFDEEGRDFPRHIIPDYGYNSFLNVTFNTFAHVSPKVSKMEIELGPSGACIGEFGYRMPGLNSICGCSNNSVPASAFDAVNFGGACCHEGGKQCTDYPSNLVCTEVAHGTWYRGRSCAEGNFCPNSQPTAGMWWGTEKIEYFDDDDDNKNPLN